MSKKSEIYQDIIEHCDIILNLLKPFEAENDTPEGRMIYQCRWLKEQVETNKLPLPTDDYMHTLNYVSAEGLLNHLAKNKETAWQEVGRYLYRLVVLVDNKLITKRVYYPYISHMIDTLINLLKHPGRPLSEHEKDAIPELEQLKQLLAEGKIEPPLMSYLPDYHNFNEVNMYKVTIDDLPNGKTLVKTVANLLFEGIRPDSWLTPEEAERLSKDMP